jgi:uncharacterized membrane protein YtjA (UPF0391 family)
MNQWLQAARMQARCPAYDNWRDRERLCTKPVHRITTTPIPMLNYALIFLIVAILAGVLGFGVVAGTAAMIAKVCFVVFLVLFLFSLFSGGRRRL